MRSPRIGHARNVTTSGEMKEMAIASVTPTNFAALKKKNVAPKRVQREFRCTAEHAASFEVGQEIGLDKIFEEGQFLDVRGISRGRGFTASRRRRRVVGSATWRRSWR